MGKNEIAKAENFELTTFDGELAKSIKEELDGLGPLPFDAVKIPSGGGTVFELPGDDEDNPETAKEIVGVIVHHYPINSFWENEYTGDNTPPACASLDGKKGVESATGTVYDCKTCYRNQYGSGGKGNGKACKNSHRCYILRPEEPIPLLLTLPPTSLRALRDYIGKKILVRGMLPNDVITKITLKKEKSADGITYSKAVFTFVSELSAEDKIKAGVMKQQLKEMTQPDITMDDYNIAPTEVEKKYTSNSTDEEFFAADIPPEFVDAQKNKS